MPRSFVQLSMDEQYNALFWAERSDAILYRICLETVGSFGKTYPMVFVLLKNR